MGNVATRGSQTPRNMKPGCGLIPGPTGRPPIIVGGNDCVPDGP